MTSPYIIGNSVKKKNIEAIFAMLFRWTHHGVLRLTITGDIQDPTATKTYIFTQLKPLDIVVYDEQEQEIFKLFFSHNQSLRIGEELPGLAEKIEHILQKTQAQSDVPARAENIGFFLTFMMRASFFGLLLLLVPYVFVRLSIQRGLQTVLSLGFGLPLGLRILAKIRKLIQIQFQQSNQLASQIHSLQTLPSYDQQKRSSEVNPLRRSQELCYHIALGDYINRCEAIKNSINTFPTGRERKSAPVEEMSLAIRMTIQEITHILIEQAHHLSDNENQISV